MIPGRQHQAGPLRAERGESRHGWGGAITPPPQAAATLPSQAAAVRLRCPHPAKEDGDSPLSLPQGLSLMLEQRAMGLPSSSADPKIGPGVCRAWWEGNDTTLHGANPAPLALTSLLLQFPRRVRGNPARREVEGRGGDAPVRRTAPSVSPSLHTRFCFAGTSTKELLPALGPSPWQVWQQRHGPGTGCELLPQPAPAGHKPRCHPAPHLPCPQGVSPEEDAAVPTPRFGPVVERQDIRGEAALRGVPAGVPVACRGHGWLSRPGVGHWPWAGGSLSERRGG